MLWSLALLAACLGLLYNVTDWHASVKNKKKNLPIAHHHHNGRALPVVTAPSSSSFWSSYSFSSASSATTATASASDDANNANDNNDKKKKNPNDPDDFDGDGKCRAYLLNFLNGTTDAQDECAGMYHAYSDSDCKDEIMDHNLIFRLLLPQDGDGKNDSDVVTMDDVFETWGCCEEISSYYAKHCQEDELLDASRLLAIVAVFILCGLVQSILRVTNFRWIPDAGACILVGAVVGGVARLIYPASVVRNKLIFNSHLFLQILLPPIIFQAALSIDKRAFRRDLFPILLFAICGTAFAAVAIALVTFHLSSAFAGGGKNDDDESSGALPLLDCLLFGSLMSSIDPVATLSILSGVGASKSDTLYTLVFGESLLNDGVSIVLFDSFLRIMNADNQDDAAGSGGGGGAGSVLSISSTLYHVVFIAVGSILVGLICGAICNIFFWLFKGMHTAVTEVALFFTWALVPYYIADGLELSGIISILAMAFVLDSYVIGGSAALDERRERQRRQQQHREQQAFEYRTLGRPISNEDNLQEQEQYHQELQQQRQQHHRPPRAPALETLASVWSRAFSGHGHLLELSCNHVGFVAKVMASLMETAIFAYLGLFLFNDNVTSGQWKFTANGIFACVSSRVVMVIGLSMLVNFCVLIDLEDKLGRLWACFVGSDSRSFRSRARLVAAGGATSSSRDLNNNDNNVNAAAASSIRLNDPAPIIPPSYLTPKTQLILILSGVRGAVSYALVQNIPVYDSVTRHGSHFKGELRAMTSGTIVVILFVFGALTYFSVGHEDAAAAAQDDLHGLQHRRPRPLGGGGDDSDMSQLLLREEDTYNEATGAQHEFSGGRNMTSSNATSLEIDFRGQQRSSSAPGQLS